MKSILNPQPTTGASKQPGQVTGGSSSLGGTSSPTQKRVAETLLSIVDALRDGCNDPELPAQAIALLMHVAARRDPPTVLELGTLTGMSKASASRLVQNLGRGQRATGREGVGVIETREDPMNYTRKMVYLTPKGQRLMDLIETKLLAGMKGA